MAAEFVIHHIVPDMEIEVRCKMESPLMWLAEVKDIVSVTTLQTVNVIDKNVVKVIRFQGAEKLGTDIYKKERKGVFEMPNYKIVASTETPYKEQTHVELVRIKNRFRIRLAGLPRWFLDVTFVVQQSGLNIQAIKATKAELFLPFEEVEKIMLVAQCQCEIEFELDSANCSDVSQEEIAKDLCLIEKMIQKPKNDVPLFIESLAKKLGRKGSTLKSLLTPVIEVNKQIYKDNVHPYISDLFLSDKADGMRVVVVCQEEITWFTSDAMGILGSSSAWEESTFIAEAELVEMPDGPMALLYDLLELDGKPLHQLTFAERVKLQSQVILPANARCKFKPIVKMTSDESENARLINLAIQRRAPFDMGYANDGIILTLATHPAKVFKWKPLHQMTLDFVAKRYQWKMLPAEYKKIADEPKSNKDQLYILFCGITEADWKNLGIRKLPHYKHMFPVTHGNLVPVQFTPADSMNACLLWSDLDLDNKIVEVNWQSGWKVTRIREDREDDFKKGYYGNHYFVAEIIWRNFANPLLQHQLTSKTLYDGLYFQSTNDEWKQVREFNNRVKEEMLKLYRFGDSVIDLGCGKGQDMLKYFHLGLNKMVFVDCNENNLCEAIQRRRKLIQSKKWLIQLTTICADLKLPWSEMSKKWMIAGALDSAHLVCCNFAVHYLLSSKKAMLTFVQMCKRLCMRDGYCIISGLDGGKIHERFMDTDLEEFHIGNKYTFTKMYNSKTLSPTGQKIAVTVPFSQEPSVEYLINVQELTSVFEHHGFTHISSLHFDQVQDPKCLSKDDSEYVQLLFISVFMRV